MKRVIKTILLGTAILGVVIACDSNDVKSSSSLAQSSSVLSSAISSSEESSSSLVSSSSETRSSSVFSSSLMPSSSSSLPSSSSSIPQSSSSSLASSSSIAPTLTGISLNTNNIKKSYHINEQLSLVNLVVTANYSNGSANTINNYSSNPRDGAVLSTAGEQKVIISYENFSDYFMVNVDAGTAVVNTDNVKKNYYQGEALDLTNLQIYTQFADSTTAVINSYTSRPANGDTLNALGEQTVAIIFNNSEGVETTYSFTINVEKAPKTAWTDEEKAIMTAHLHGVVLPYTGFEESVVIYDEEANVVLIQGGLLETNTLANYASLITAAGFKRVNSSSYVYEKGVQTADGKRFVRVGFMSNSGSFYLEAYDPYHYSFPTAFAKEIASSYFGSSDVPPAFEGADYYEASSSYVAIFCYVESTTANEDYTALLKTAGWDVQDEKKEGYFVAISPDGKYAVCYLYNTELGSFDIYFGPVDFWNKSVVEAFFNKYNGYVVDIPAFNVKGAEYVFTESNLNEQAYYYGVYEAIHAFMYIYGAKATDVATYVDILTTAGWEVSLDGNTYRAYLTIPDEGIARIEFAYNDKEGAIVVTIYFMLDPIPVIEWPAKEIADLLGEYLTDIVPEYTGANQGFTILNDMFGTAVMVKIEKNTEDAALASYIQTLTTNGYTALDEEEYGENYFISQNKEIIVNVYWADRGSITIAFEKAPLTGFPSAVIDMMFDATDTVPASTDADSYSYRVVDNGQHLEITCLYSSDNAATVGFNNYVQALLNAEYSAYGNIAGYTSYRSKNEEFIVTPYKPGGPGFYILVYGPLANQSKWPANTIANLFTAEGYTDVLPSYDEACDGIDAYKYYDGNIYIDVSTSNGEQVKNSYIKQLTDAKFTLKDYNSYGDPIYKSPSNQYTVEVSFNRFGMTLKIIKMESVGPVDNGFPMEEIIADFPTADGVLPSIDDPNATFVYEDPFEGEGTVIASFISGEAALTAYSAYINALTTAGFTYETGIWSYIDAYVSPDRSFMIEFDTDDLSKGSFEFTIMSTYGAI